MTPVPEAETIACPLCEYDLRGQVDPRCPECGFTFEWEELRDPERRRHPYLFEHYPERSLWSFTRTLVGSLRPRRFWTTLTPNGRSSTRRLVVYWLLTLALGLPAFGSLFIATVTTQQVANAEGRARWAKIYASARPQQKVMLDQSFGTSYQDWLVKNYPPVMSQQFWTSAMRQPLTQSFFPLLLLCAAWPWATALTMRLTLSISLHRSRLRAIHFLRCTMYSADAVAWVAIMAFVGGVVLTLWGVVSTATPGIVWGVSSPSARQTLFVTLTIGTWLLILTVLYRLTVAVSKYLRLKRAVVIVLLTQIITLISTALILHAIFD